MFFLYYLYFTLLFFLIPGIDLKLRTILRDGYRPSTSRTYTSIQTRFLKFCTLYHLEPMPATELTILRFMTYLTPRVSANSMQVYLAAIRSMHVVNGFSPPPITTPRIHLAIRSLSQNAPNIKQTFPITFSILSQFGYLLTDSYNDLALWACMNILFFGCLRASELIPAVSQYRDGYLPPQVCSLQFAVSSYKAVILKVARTKTRPKGRNVVLGCSGHELVCPYCTVTRYLCIRGVKDTSKWKGPLFVLRDGTVLDKSIVRSRQSELLRKLGLPPDKFTTHAYRAGSATQLSMNGFHGIIPHIGDWSSLCYLRYIRSPLSELASNALKFIPPGC